MRKVTLFIAMSLDGYIADPQGGVDWLSGQGGEEEKDFYGEFIQGVDTVVMGGNTYRQIIEKLSPAGGGAEKPAGQGDLGLRRRRRGPGADSRRAD